MSTYATSPCGLRFKNINLGHDDISGKDITTVDVLNDLEKAFFDYQSSKDRFQYLKLGELTNKFLSVNYNGIIGMLNEQVTNVALNGAGWDFLMLVAQYSVDSDRHVPADDSSGKALDRLRSRIGTYFHTPSFKCTTEVDPVDLSKSRQEQIRSFQSKNNIQGNDLSITNILTPTLYGDRILLCNFLDMLLFKDSR